jgi:hypothetical protein
VPAVGIDVVTELRPVISILVLKFPIDYNPVPMAIEVFTVFKSKSTAVDEDRTTVITSELAQFSVVLN